MWNSITLDSIDYDGLTFSVTDWDKGQWEPVEPIDTKWYIAGGFNNWAEGMVELTGAKEDSITVDITLKSDTAVEFKLVRINTQGLKADTTWYGFDAKDAVSYEHADGFWFFAGQNNVKMIPTKVGTYTFIVDPTHENEGKLVPVVSVVMPKPDPIVTTWYIAGGFNNWAEGMTELTGAKEDSITVDIALKSDTAVEFKLVRINTQGEKKDTTWFGSNYPVVRYGESSNLQFYEGQNNVKMIPTKVGTYTFIVNPTNVSYGTIVPIVSVVMPEPDPEVIQWYIAGDFNNWAAGMTELTGKKVDSLTADINLKADTIVYFKLVRVITQGEKKDTT
jgi:uncharacterized protein YbcI